MAGQALELAEVARLRAGHFLVSVEGQSTFKLDMRKVVRRMMMGAASAPVARRSLLAARRRSLFAHLADTALTKPHATTCSSHARLISAALTHCAQMRLLKEAERPVRLIFSRSLPAQDQLEAAAKAASGTGAGGGGAAHRRPSAQMEKEQLFGLGSGGGSHRARPVAVSECNAFAGAWVIRGHHWNRGAQDGGSELTPGPPGVIMAWRARDGSLETLGGAQLSSKGMASLPPMCAVVRWSTGKKYFYPCGKGSEFILAHCPTVPPTKAMVYEIEVRFARVAPLARSRAAGGCDVRWLPALRCDVPARLPACLPFMSVRRLYLTFLCLHQIPMDNCLGRGKRTRKPSAAQAETEANNGELHVLPCLSARSVRPLCLLALLAACEH
jgi:hypothetical protein